MAKKISRKRNLSRPGWQDDTCHANLKVDVRAPTWADLGKKLHDPFACAVLKTILVHTSSREKPDGWKVGDASPVFD